MTFKSASVSSSGVLRFSVHVHPGSATSFVGGAYDGALQVRVRARAMDGAATNEVCTALANAFGVRSRVVQCVRGLRSRTKLIAIEGNVDDLSGKLEILLARTVLR
jgi:uncharacterized protein